MGFSAKIILIFAFSVLLIIPISVMAQEYTVKTDNQTITIVVKPNNTIINQAENNTKLEQIIQQITNKPEPKWTQGDVLIGSSTIVGFFSIGSMVSIRFREETKTLSFPLLAFVITISGMVISFHVFVMLSIVEGTFDHDIYHRVMIATIIAVWFNVYLIIRINYYENKRKRAASKPNEFKKSVEEIQKQLQRQINETLDGIMKQQSEKNKENNSNLK